MKSKEVKLYFVDFPKQKLKKKLARNSESTTNLRGFEKHKCVTGIQLIEQAFHHL